MFNGVSQSSAKGFESIRPRMIGVKTTTHGEHILPC